MDDIHSDGCYKPRQPAGTTGDVDEHGEIVDGERPEMGVWLLARLRMHVVSSWFEPDDGEAGTPAVQS